VRPLLVFIVLSAAPALAQGTAVTTVGIPDGAGFAAVLEEGLAPFDVPFRVEATPALDLAAVLDGSAPLRAYVEVGERRARVLLAQGERVLVRALDLPEGLDAVALEELGQIVVVSLIAFVEGGDVGVGRREAAALLGVRLAPDRGPAPEAARRVSLDVAWRLAGWASEAGPFTGPHLGLAYARDGVGVALRGGFWLPVEAVAPGDARVELRGGNLRAEALLRAVRAPRLALWVTPGIGLTVLRAGSTELAGAQLPSHDPLVRLGVAAVGALRLGPRVTLEASVGLDLSLAFGFALVAGPRDAPGTVVAPWALWPHGALRVRFDLYRSGTDPLS
jgi:hypothetical protein